MTSADPHAATPPQPGPGGRPPTDPPPTDFWARATTGKAVLLVVGYLAFYLLVGQVAVRVFGGVIADDPLDDPLSTLLATALPIAVGGVALAVFAARRGWLAPIFARQPVEGRRWMWIAPILVVAAIVGHVAGVDWSSWSPGQLAALAVLGACIGFTEELATRGIVVKVLRDAGHGERYVLLVSSLLFALMHMVNLLTGQESTTVLVTVVYTFGFGACMYLTMRVTGTIWAAIVLHAVTDPVGILAAGGIDSVGAAHSGGGSAASGTLTTVVTVLMPVLAVVAVFLVRGKAGTPGAPDAARPAAVDPA